MKATLQHLRAKFAYKRYWKQHQSGWEYGINIIDKCLECFTPETILDAGCGSGEVVKYLHSRGFHAKGVDITLQGTRINNASLIKNGFIIESSLESLPFGDNAFDVVFSSEVLEHIPEEKIPIVIDELYRVTKSHFFGTISLRPSSNNNRYHVTLRERDWWESRLINAGFRIERDLISRYQRRCDGMTNAEVLMMGPTQRIMHEIRWFIEAPPYDLRGELEPWYFICSK
jgi:ubiquinone/menaquinone biosynthesis C-methylase UbiE